MSGVSEGVLLCVGPCMMSVLLLVDVQVMIHTLSDPFLNNCCLASYFSASSCSSSY